MLSGCCGCSTTPDHRTYSLGVIAQHTKLSLDGVEFLLMKALSLHLIEGVIDQVAGIVQVRCPNVFYNLYMHGSPLLSSQSAGCPFGELDELRRSHFAWHARRSGDGGRAEKGNDISRDFEA